MSHRLNIKTTFSVMITQEGEGRMEIILDFTGLCQQESGWIRDPTKSC